MSTRHAEDAVGSEQKSEAEYSERAGDGVPPEREPGKGRHQNREQELKAGHTEHGNQKRENHRACHRDRFRTPPVPHRGPVNQGERRHQHTGDREIVKTAHMEIGVGVRHMAHQKGYKAQDTRLD